MICNALLYYDAIIHAVILRTYCAGGLGYASRGESRPPDGPGQKRGFRQSKGNLI